MRKQKYLKEKKDLKRDIRVFKRHVSWNSGIISPIAQVCLVSTTKKLDKLNYNYRNNQVRCGEKLI